MDKDLSRAAELLRNQDDTCVLCTGDTIYTSRQRGIKPLLEFLDAGLDITGFSAADKVVGKATALLYCLLGIKAVYAPVISRPALQVLENNHVEVHYDMLTDVILNHRKDGICPMENAVRDINDPHQALIAVLSTLKVLQQK